MEKEQSKISDVKLHNYIFDREIGHGASGVCYKAFTKNGKYICAIKKISINSIKGNSLKLALKEVEVLKTLNHPNIIKYYDSFADDNHLYIVMQYAQKGDLHTLLKRRKIKKQFYPEIQIWAMAKQLLQAVKYLHSKNIIHRDLKTLNIFIGEKNNLLLGDLGVSTIIKNDMVLYSRVGTPLYLAPEIIKYEKYDYKADIWGFGCVMYVIASLSYPFQGKNLITLGENILHTDPKPIFTYSTELNNFIKLALQKNPNKRLNATQLFNLFYCKNNQKNKNIGSSSTDKKIGNIDADILDNNNNNNNNNNNFSNELCIKLGNHNQTDTNKNQYRMKIMCIPQNCKQDETVVLPQSLILKIVDGYHQKTRIRTQFLSKKKSSFTKSQLQQHPIKFIQQSIHQKQTPNAPQTTSTNKNNKSVILPCDIKPLPIKFQTQPIQTLKNQNPKQQESPKPRNIQSACLRSATTVIKKQLVSSYRIQTNQQFSYFQQQKNNLIRKTQPRPKTCIGRKNMTINYQSKYIKRKKLITNQELYQTKTQMLRKPEFIVI